MEEAGIYDMLFNFNLLFNNSSGSHKVLLIGTLELIDGKNLRLKRK